jgi:GH24 family phage-related lysozyme (muramidase)
MEVELRAEYIEAIKRFEGFTPRAQWDYAQFSNGYGTRARRPEEVIDRAEADRRFAGEIDEARERVLKYAPGLDDGTTAALTSLTFNSGSRWMSAGLGEKIKAGDLDAAREIFKQYVNAGGRKLEGLVARRAVEASWIGDGRSGSGSAASVPIVEPELQSSVIHRVIFEGPERTDARMVAEPEGTGGCEVPDASGLRYLEHSSFGSIYLEIIVATLAARVNWSRSRDDGMI